MIEVLINWIFIAITSYSLGYIVFTVLSKLLNLGSEHIHNANIYRIILGLALVNVYAEIWSIFGPVGAWADFVLIAIAILIIYLCKEGIVKELKFKMSVKTGVYIFLILLWSYGTSRGYMHFDTNLYHAQAIRWIEDYGIVPGLANLQSRFGYNSAEFALNALYSGKWCLGQSLHCTAGFFALISSFVIVSGRCIIAQDDSGKRKINVKTSDFVRLGLFFYLATIYSEIISPASDYYAQLLIFDIVILWLDNLEEKCDEDRMKSIQGILCIVLVYSITIKLSLGLLILLAFIPGVYWIKKKNIKAIISCIISGLIIAIPYFIRNYIISGWILYPSTLIRLGSPDWQLPIGEAQYDAKEISMWGKGITSATEWNSVSLVNWIPNWIMKLSMMEKLWVMGSLLSIVIIVALAVWKMTTKKMDMTIPVLVVLAIGTIFWFASAPLVRYGYAYLIILPMITIGYMVTDGGMALGRINIGKLSVAALSFIVIAVCVCLLKGKSLAEDIIRTINYPYYISQQDYIDGEATSYSIDGIDIYVATDAGQIGYYKFPATPNMNTDIKLRGRDLSSGFMKK